MYGDSNDLLRELLFRAAEDPAAPAAPGDLAARARRKARRRAQRRSAAMTMSCTSGAVLAVLFLLLRSRGPEIAAVPKPIPDRPFTESDRGRLRVELASLDAEAAGYRRVVEDLKRSQAAEEKARRAQELLAQPSVLERIEAARQRAALMLVRDAEQAAGDSERKSQAVESYRRAARLFPDTPAGRLAAGRLKTPLIPT